MANISASMVKELRERTGLGMMDCKKALSEADGDMEKAIEDLRKASGLKAAKKASRVAAEGVVLTKIADGGNYGVIIEVNSETDFVARDDNFLGFADQVLHASFSDKEADTATLLASGIEDARQALVQKIGENINLRRIERLSMESETSGIIESYIHNNKIGVSEIYSAQAQESGKPEEIIKKMSEGRLRKFVAEISLMEQAFVKDPDSKVGKLLQEANAEVAQFVRFEVGEGIEKEEDDFAAEVAAQLAT